MIVDQAEQKGTGRWTAQDALELGVPLTAITEAVFARSLSALRDQRDDGVRRRSPARSRARARTATTLVDDIRKALYASKVVAYAQGFEQMAAAAQADDWDLDLGAMATIWRGGCIIRARFLDRIREAYAEHRRRRQPAARPYFRDAVADAQDAWRRVISHAVDRASRCRRSRPRSPTTTATGASAGRRT